MNRYTIYCTKEQTERAYKLGAPLEADRAEFALLNIPTICIGQTKGEYGQKVGIYRACPTAEQMCGWLRENGYNIAVSPCGNSNDYSYYVVIASEEIRIGAGFKGIMPTYKDAILSAIDAALESLEKGK